MVPRSLVNFYGGESLVSSQIGMKKAVFERLACENLMHLEVVYPSENPKWDYESIFAALMLRTNPTNAIDWIPYSLSCCIVTVVLNELVTALETCVVAYKIWGTLLKQETTWKHSFHFWCYLRGLSCLLLNISNNHFNSFCFNRRRRHKRNTPNPLPPSAPL